MCSFEVVYEEENFLIVNKASGLLVHRDKHTDEKTLIDLVNERYKKTFYLVHRIDKHTSGLLIIAKSKYATYKFQELFMSSNIDKDYLAIITNWLPAKEIDIKLSIGPSKSSRLMFSTWNAKRYKSAHTYAIKLEKQLIKLKLKTGRTHQIRAHLFSIKCPILNDPIYGQKIEGDDFNQYLHAFQLVFVNPFTNKQFSITLPPPLPFLNKLKELEIFYPLNKNPSVLIDEVEQNEQ